MRSNPNRKHIRNYVLDKLDKVMSVFAELIYMLDGEHKRCENCDYCRDEICLFFVSKIRKRRCIYWEKRNDKGNN